MTIMRLRLTGRKSFPAKRTMPGHYDEYGQWVEGEEEEFEVKGNEQPLPGDEMLMLPDSFRSRDIRKFFSITRLNSMEEEDGINPDKVQINGVWFSVLKRAEFQMGVRDHYEYTLVREEQSAGGTR